MNPIAFQLFGVEVRWYGILIGAGIILALLLVDYNCKKKNLDFDNFINIFLIALPIAILGARLYYVVFELDYYKNHINEILNIRQGGLAIHGGLIFGVLSTYIYTKVKKIDFLTYVDIAAPSIILAQAIGRWGNFFNGEAHGGEVSYNFISKFPLFIQKGMHIDGVYYAPTFLYESIWNLIVCVILLQILKKSLKEDKGIVLASYMILYSIGRFVIEGLRTDSLLFMGLRTAQIVSILGIIIGSSIIIVIKHRKVHNG